MYRYSRFSSFASRVARTLGHPATFMLFLGAALLWLATGPLFHFSSNWYGAYSNTATIVTTLLLFIIQHTQSREIASIQFKLNEIIRVSEGAHNALLDIEEMTDRDYDRIKASYTILARQAREQLQSGKLKWATARVSMESLDSFFSPAASEDEDNAGPQESFGSAGLASAKVTARHPAAFSEQFAASLDRMARVAAHSGHAPIAFLAVHDKDHAWLLRQTGFEQIGLDGTADDTGEPAWTGLARLLAAQSAAARQAVVVGDTSEQPLPPEIHGGSRATAFLAIPLIGAHQRVMGCLGVVDIKPRQWRDTEIAALQDLAALTVEQITEQARQRPAAMPAPAPAPAVSVPPAVSAPAEAAPPIVATLFTPPDPAAIPAPASEADAPDTPPAEEPCAAPTAPGTILVVDDSSSNRDLLQRRLEREGYCVLTAGNGREALECLQSEPVGLVLLDVMMPEMDGEEVLQHIQGAERLKNIPVIMVTALDEQDSVQRCLNAGAKDYILKPLDPAQLRARVHAYLPPPPRPAPTV